MSIWDVTLRQLSCGHGWEGDGVGIQWISWAFTPATGRNKRVAMSWHVIDLPSRTKRERRRPARHFTARLVFDCIVKGRGTFISQRLAQTPSHINVGMWWGLGVPINCYTHKYSYIHLFAVNLGASARCLEIVHSISKIRHSARLFGTIAPYSA